MRSRKRRILLGLGCVPAMAAFASMAWERIDKPSPPGSLARARTRPQTPVAPLPYEERQVSFENRKSAVRLAGTLTLPRGGGRPPAIVLIPGAGEVTRDGALFGHQFYLVLADYLTRRGFAVLRCDKRGLGRSGGSYAAATTYDFASDIEAGVAFLRGRPDIDAARIGLVGHSEGALIGAMVAGSDPAIRFLVSMAGNGIPAREMLLARARYAAAAKGSPEAAPREVALQRAVLDAVEAPGSDAERGAAIRALYAAAQRAYGRPFTEQEIAPFLGPWLRVLLLIDPAALLRRVRCPVLALVGDKDQVVTAAENIPALERALAANPGAQVQRLPGLNHFFQTAQSGDVAEMAEIEETMAPRALELIGSWAVRQADGRAAG
jgi:pimeloyl-ACP methyl ester carboxylesterase